MTRSALGAGLQARLFLRSLLLQACWSRQRMQNLGFCYAIDPFLARVWKDAGDLRAARLRHQEFFNTQPVMASLVLGIVCALEEDLASAEAAQRPAKLARLLALKRGAAGALAGIGDALFWGSLRPFGAAAALAAGLALSEAGLAREGLWAMPAAIVLTFAAPALWLRWQGLRWGYEAGEGIGARLQAVAWQAWVARLRAGARAAAAAAALLMLGAAALEPAQRLAGLLTAGAALAALAYLPSATPYRVYGAAAGLGVLASIAGWP